MLFKTQSAKLYPPFHLIYIIMLKHLKWCAGLLLLLTSHILHAQQLGVALRAGSLGVGLDVSASVSERLRVRVGATMVPEQSQRIEQAFDELDGGRLGVDITGALKSGFASLDVHPFKSAFRVSLGAKLNGGEISFTGQALDPYDLEGEIFTPEEVGTLTGTWKHGQKVSPMISIGASRGVFKQRRFGIMFDVGAMMIGSSKIALSGTGLIQPTANQDEIINEALAPFKWAPFMQFGINFRLTN